MMGLKELSKALLDEKCEKELYLPELYLLDYLVHDLRKLGCVEFFDTSSFKRISVPTKGV